MGLNLHFGKPHFFRNSSHNMEASASSSSLPSLTCRASLLRSLKTLVSPSNRESCRMKLNFHTGRNPHFKEIIFSPRQFCGNNRLRISFICWNTPSLLCCALLLRRLQPNIYIFTYSRRLSPGEGNRFYRVSILQKTIPGLSLSVRSIRRGQELVHLRSFPSLHRRNVSNNGPAPILIKVYFIWLYEFERCSKIPTEHYRMTPGESRRNLLVSPG